MTCVRLLGWSPGLNKVRLTKLIRSSTGMPLDEAHAAVNKLLAGESVELPVDSLETGQHLAAQACALGAKAECLSTPESSTVAS